MVQQTKEKKKEQEVQNNLICITLKHGGKTCTRKSHQFQEYE